MEESRRAHQRLGRKLILNKRKIRAKERQMEIYSKNEVKKL
ncbi:MAG: hypothetical protein ACJAU2_001105 [Maribacter sp.]|jgi:hypothetical protein